MQRQRVLSYGCHLLGDPIPIETLFIESQGISYLITDGRESWTTSDTGC
jgi:hypothetical protein